MSKINRGAGSGVRAGAVLLAALLLPGLATGCVPRAEPEPAEIRTTAPPWPAPRDTISNIELTGLPQLPLDTTGQARIFTLTVTIDGAPVTVPPYVGIDRIRAVQAAAHTHEDRGEVWLEGQGTDQVTLQQFFVLWGVRLDEHCLGNSCGILTVTADGKPVAEPLALKLAEVTDTLEVSVRDA